MSVLILRTWTGTAIVRAAYPAVFSRSGSVHSPRIAPDVDPFEGICSIFDPSLTGVRSRCHPSAIHCAVCFSPTWRSQSGTDKTQVPVPCPLHSTVDCPAATASVPVPPPARSALFLPSFPSLRPLASSHPPRSQSFVFLIYPLPPILSFPIHSFFPIPSPPAANPAEFPIFDLE